jgi:hypothetical protein
MESVHRKAQYPCRLATSLGCPKMYTSRHDADKQADYIRHKIRHPCLMAEEAGCISTFATSLNAQVHVDGIHRQVRWPCPCHTLSVPLYFQRAGNGQRSHD